MKKYLHTSLIFLYFIGISIGVDYELSSFYGGAFSTKDFALLAAGAGFLFLYILPLLGLLLYVRKRWLLPIPLLPLAIFSGMFLSGWMASLGNDALGMVWQHLLPKGVYTDWEAALTAPFVEEIVKCLAALYSLYFLRKWSAKTALLAGAGAGLGFQIIEDISYLTNAVYDTPKLALADTFLRISGSLASHWVYTGLVTVGLFLLLSIKKQRKRGATLIATVVLVHFIWNSPFSSIPISLNLHTAILSAIPLLILYQTYRSIDQKP